jgi:hypothetical protein
MDKRINELTNQVLTKADLERIRREMGHHHA